MNKITLVAISAAIIIVGVGSFYGGMKYDQSKNSASLNKNAQRFQQLGANGGNSNRSGIQGMQNGGLVNGDIISQDDKSVTVKLRDGGSKIIFLSASTSISKMTVGLLRDLKIGQQIMVTGTTNQDGSITAQSIQIRPTPIPTSASK